MNQKTSKELLNEAIEVEEKNQFDEWVLLKQQFHLTYQGLKPINLIKSTLEEITQTPEIENSIISNVIGLATGFLTKKVLLGESQNPVKNAFGFILQFAVSKFISKNSEGIKTAGKYVFSHFLKSKKHS